MQYAISKSPCAYVSKRVLVQSLSCEFDLYEKEPVGTHFHMNGLPRRLVLRRRQKTTRSERRRISHLVVSPQPLLIYTAPLSTGKHSLDPTRNDQQSIVQDQSRAFPQDILRLAAALKYSDSR